MTAAYRHRCLKVRGEMDILTPHLPDALFADGREKPGSRPVKQMLRGLRLLQFHIHLDRVALIRPYFCVIFIEGIALFVVLTDNALQSVHIDPPPGSAHTGQKLLHIGPAVLIQRDPRRAGIVPQDQAEKPAQLHIIRALWHCFPPLSAQLLT